ncbi:FCD domain-containing protein [Phytohabitans kaempferiae]|uniref:FCD domain-containing protein n=1 Tax=Phytohabitans kaempferiae TaxID=1620943 RepID=A0ABV6MDT5_9ACTN
MIVDAHHHLWGAGQGYAWLDAPELAPIRRTFGPADLAAAVEGSGVLRTVLVEGGRCDTGEAELLLGYATESPLVAGVVAWADPEDPALADTIAGYRALPGGDRLAGIRSQVQGESDPGYLDRSAVRRGDDEVDGLRAVLAGLGDDPSLDALVANDLEFHRRIAAGSGNGVLCSLIDSLSGPTTRARIWRGLTQEGAVAKTREQHAAILDAIASRQPELARSWATVHVAGVEDWLRRAL